ncbi:MAG: helix-turn-helix transcriptional regulator [Zoogloea sp.]|nr:helix-turn-helix transcriptional regulator [Zoogloea sp.]
MPHFSDTTGHSVTAAQDEQQHEAAAAGLDEESARLLATLARNIRLFRSQRGMTRKNLAEQSGVSLPHLARLESSQGNVSVVVLGKVARALNQPVANLFSEHELLSGDLALIVEFLRQQPAARLTDIREKLFSEFQPAASARAQRIALIGLRGAGKSTVGKALAARLGRPFIELNEQIEREAGLSVQEIITLYGQAGYRKLEKRCLEELAVSQPEVVLATGGGIVVEPQTYQLLLGAFYTVWLRADPEVHFRRVMEQHDARIATPSHYREAMENIRNTLAAREHLGRMAALAIDTTPLTVDEVVEKIVEGAGGALG